MIIGAFITVFLCLFGHAQAQTYSADQQTAKQSGADSANTTLGVVSTPTGITTKMSNPIVGGSQMTTIDGKKSFNGQISCPSTKQFLAVTILPSSTGDLSMVMVQQDTTLSGFYNYVYNAPVRASGICANGIISCDAGTWNNCTYYQWTADASGKSSLALVPSIQQLAGCYCINNSCGITAMTDLNIILHDLGTGVANVIQGNNPQYVITGSTVQDTTVSYYGQQASNCQMATSASSGNLTQYANDPTGMENAGQAAITSQQSDPSSYYSLVTQASQNAQGPTNLSQCTMFNNAVLTTTQVPTTNPISFTFYVTADNQFNLYLDGALILSGGNWAATYSKTMNLNPGNHTISITGTDWGGGYRGILFAAKNNGDSTWPVVSKSSWSSVTANYGSVGVGPWGVPGGWPGASAWWIWGSGNPSTVSTTLNAVLMVYQDTMDDSVITDNCINDENNSQCQLKDEVVDGVQTYQNYNPTGLTPLPSCKDFTGMTQIFTVCHNWWTKTRSYVCATGGSYDFSDIKKRITSIQSTATDGGSVLTFTDMRKDSSGNWITENDSITLTPRDAATCQHACKIKRPATNTQAGTAGNTSQYQTTIQSYSIIYAQCDSSDNCPTQTGDIVDIKCQCINDFAEAVTVLSALNEAGKDMICSTGTPQ